MADPPGPQSSKRLSSRRLLDTVLQSLSNAPIRHLEVFPALQKSLTALRGKLDKKTNPVLFENICHIFSLFLEVISAMHTELNESNPSSDNSAEKFLMDSMSKLQSDFRSFTAQTTATLQDSNSIQKDTRNNTLNYQADVSAGLLSIVKQVTSFEERVGDKLKLIEDASSIAQSSINTGLQKIDTLHNMIGNSHASFQDKFTNLSDNFHFTQDSVGNLQNAVGSLPEKLSSLFSTDSASSSSMLDCNTITALQSDVSELKLLQPTLQNLMDELKVTTASNKKSYAEILSLQSKLHKPATPLLPLPPQSAKPTIILKPKGADPGQDFLPLIKSLIDPSKTKTRIDRASSLSSGNILIQTKTDSEATNLLNELSSNTTLQKSLDVHKQQKRKPRIILLNLPPDFDSTSVKDTLVKQNEYLTADNFDVSFKIPAKNGVHWVITLHPSVYKFVTQENHLYFGWSKIHFKDFHYLRQCNQCFRFGHLGHSCTESKLCINCSSPHHAGECTSAHPVCINCSDHNNKFHNDQVDFHHSSKSFTCPTRAKQINFLSKFVDYGFPSSSPPIS